MRAIVIHDGARRTAQLAEAIAAGLNEAAIKTELHVAQERPSAPLSVAPYDLVCVGSSIVSFFGGRISDAIDATVRQCSRMEGKTVAAFVAPRLFGTTKALRRLMEALERQGAIVRDFSSPRSRGEAAAFGRRLESLLQQLE